MDLFTTNSLIDLVQELPPAKAPLYDRYFRLVVQETSEEIHFDKVNHRRRIAPFVSPLIEGKIISANARKVETFTPAYIKDKRPIDQNAPFKRAAGETWKQPMTPEQRLQAYLLDQMQDQEEMIARRLEVMASEILRSGQVTISGEGYPTVVLNFGRAAGNLITPLTTTARWNDSAPKPPKNLRDWSLIGLQSGGYGLVDVIMGTDAFSSFADNAEVRDKLKAVRDTATNTNMGFQQSEGLVQQGVYENFNIFSYAGWYVDPVSDTETAIWPADQVVLVAPPEPGSGKGGVEGVRAFGAIRDGKAGFRAMPFFPKIWEENDPAVQYLMMQSAPLLFPLRPNCTVMADVQ